MGGKTSTSTSAVNVPPAVLAQYQAVNSQAEQTAETPFEDYGGQFVAPVNAEQTAGIAGTNAAANEAQPYYGAATGVLGGTQAATTPVNTAAEIGTAESGAPISGADINSYLSPYLGDVLSSTEAIQNQENQQAQAGQLGDAITSGAFGSDRTGIAAANLQQQENLANSSTIANIANTGYQSALTEANTEQQTGLAAANQLASIGSTAYGEGANTANELGTLGTGAESAGLAGAQAQIAAGTVQQQTQQAQDTAEYNQFLQQQSYPFQVDQFLANIAEGTGSLSGSTTTTTQPQGILSDRRLKRDIKKIGETFDGQTVYTYKMGDDPTTHIGLMAQEVERKYPKAVGLAAGFKTVDYGKATREAANQGHFRTGGVVPFRRVHRDMGGGLAGVLQAQQQMYGAMPGAGVGRQIPSAGGGGYSLAVAHPAAAPPSSLDQAVDLAQLAKMGRGVYKYYYPSSSQPAPDSTATGNAAPAEANAALNSQSLSSDDGSGSDTSAPPDANDPDSGFTRGGIAGSGRTRSGVARRGFFGGGESGDALANTAPTPAASAPTETYSPEVAADPYGEGTDAQQLNIPTGSGQHTLAAAPAGNPVNSTKQDLSDFVSAVGQFLKRGGVVGNSSRHRAMGGLAGRRGFDGGGGATDDDDPTTVPDDTTVTASGPSPGVAPSAPAAATAPSAATASPTTGGGIAGWWGRNKGTILPILAGIGEAGTEPTVHPGIALAAGLKGFANAYTPTQEGLAQAQQTQAAAQGQQIANRIAGLKLGVAQQALAPSPGGVVPRQAAASPQQQGPSTTVNPAPAAIASAGAPSVPARPVGAPAAPVGASAASAQSSAPSAQPSPGAAQTAAGLAAQYRSQFFVNTARTPEEQAQKDAAIKKDWAVGGQMFEQQADTDYQARVQRDQQNNRNAAQQAADAQYAQATDQTASPAARQAALARYNALRQWTGDGTDIQGGIVKNTRTNQPEIGTIGQQGFTPQEQAAVMAQAQNLVNVPNSDGTFTQMSAWQAHHAASPQAYAQTLMPNSTAAAPTPAAAGTPQTPPAGAGAGAPLPAASAAPASPSTAARAPAASPATQAAADPYLAKALADPSWRIPPIPMTRGTTQAPMALATQQTNLANATKLLNDTDAATTVAANTLQYIRAAQSIMQSHGATVGAYGAMLAGASKWSGPFTGKVDSTNYQELAKYLGNAAAQAAKANFPSATQQEVGMQFEEMSPNSKMNAATINDLLAVNARVATNVIANGARARAYVGNPQNPTNQPLNFQKWAQKYWPVDKVANADATAINPKTGEKLYHIDGKWVP